MSRTGLSPVPPVVSLPMTGHGRHARRTKSLQRRYAPSSVCFGCGPKNPKGLRVESRPDGDALVADWRPSSYHSAFAGYGNGGIISVLLDCHCGWAAAYSLMKAMRLTRPPGTVTSRLTVRFLRPTPLGASWHLRARTRRLDKRRAYVEGELTVRGERTAVARGVFVAVREGHPAFGRWR